jgi:hypothetical protein
MGEMRNADLKERDQLEDQSVHEEEIFKRI